MNTRFGTGIGFLGLVAAEAYMNFMKRILMSGLVLMVASLALTRCANKESIISQAITKDFPQDLNSPYVDILWMINDRSPMHDALPKLLPEATAFFKRLDATAQSYRMAFASADMEIHPAELRPTDAPATLNKESKANNTVEDRANYFSSILARYINLSTGPTEMGLASVKAILETKFIPRPNVPLVLIYVSDSFDASTGFTGPDAVTYYENALLALKGGDRKLIRVYAINYKPLAGEVRSTDNRCATYYHADADEKPAANERYFKLAKRFAVDLPNPDAVTGTLCKPFGAQIDITGLKAKQAPNRFKLDSNPQVNTLKVSVFVKDSNDTYDIKWTYDATTNEIVFDTAPPEGTNIRVSYFPG